MSRSKRFLSSVTIGYLYQGVMMVVGLWLAPFMLRHIGQHDYGLWLVGMQVLTYLMMLDFGIVALLPRDTAYATGRAGGKVEEAKDLPRITGETACVVLHQMPVVILAIVLIWFWMPQSWYGFRGPITLALTVLGLIFPLRIFQALLEGLQDLAFLGWLQIAIWTISTTIMIALVLGGFGLFSLAAGWSAGQLLSAAIAIYRVRSKYPMALPNRIPRLTARQLYERFARGFWVSLSQVAQPLVAGSDVLVIGKLLGPSAVVPYNCTGKLINVLSNQPQLLMQAAMPGLSELKAGGSRDSIFRATTALSQALLTISGALACVVLIVNRGFVNWWVGPKQYSGATLTALITVVMLLRHWNTTAVYATFCFGYERRFSVAMVLDGLVTLIASAVLVHQIGVIGAPLGSIAGVCAVSLPVNLTALGREVGKGLRGLLIPLWPWFWRFVILATLAVVTGRWCASLNFFQIAAVAAAAAVVYAVVMFQPSQRSILGSYLHPRFFSWAKLRPPVTAAP